VPAAACDDENAKDGRVSVATDGLDAFRTRHGFDDWREPEPGGEALFIWRFALGGQELPGNRSLRIDTLELPDLPPTIQSLWRPDKEDSDRVLLRMDVTEAPSVMEARALLLWTLAQFQSPLIERIGDGPGDVAFGASGNRALVFARANTVVVVLNAGDEVQSVDEPAREVDGLLRDGPSADRSSVRPTIRRAEVAEAGGSVRRAIRVLVEAEDPLGRHVWFRFSARRGRFRAEGDSVFFEPEDEGPQTIEVAAVNENLGVAVAQVEFTI
jgi:hypothetical protein